MKERFGKLVLGIMVLGLLGGCQSGNQKELDKSDVGVQVAEVSQDEGLKGGLYYEQFDESMNLRKMILGAESGEMIEWEGIITERLESGMYMFNDGTEEIMLDVSNWEQEVIIGKRVKIKGELVKEEAVVKLLIEEIEGL